MKYYRVYRKGSDGKERMIGLHETKKQALDHIDEAEERCKHMTVIFYVRYE